MTDSTDTIVPSGTHVSSYGVIDGLDSTSYTAQRLKHASSDHLHLTTRRFFIGPVPEGWLNSHRKSWFTRKLELNNYSSRAATFDAAARKRNKRVRSLAEEPSLAARMNFSFPQPADVNSAPNTPGLTVNEDVLDLEDEEDDQDEEEDEDLEDVVETTNIAPVATNDMLQEPDNEGEQSPFRDGAQTEPPSNTSNRTQRGSDPESLTGSRQRAESWTTAREDLKLTKTSSALAQNEVNPYDERTSTSTQRQDSQIQSNGMAETPDMIDSSSKTALLQAEGSPASPRGEIAHSGSPLLSPMTARGDQKSMAFHSPNPLNSPMTPGTWGQKPPKQSGVRFNIAEEVADRRKRIGRRAGNAKSKMTNRVGRRNTLREGTIVKMERMLVRIDATLQQLPDDFDENESIKTEAREVEKWQEFMVVARKSMNQDEEDFRLQLYKTRVIPEIDNQKTKKKPAREIKLLPQDTHVNLYSSLDKTVVMWHPYRKGTRIVIMKPCSTAHSVEWYTFLRDALGAHRPTNLQISVPDLDVALHVEKPFERLETAGIDGADERTMLAKAAEAEKAVAGKIVSQSMLMLEGDAEWAQVLQKWTQTAKMGLAWKRYDRLEWVYGINEQRMYGSMAMQHSHDLELRPKHHYPTHTTGKKGVSHEEPAPVEGFLIRLTSQKGMHKRFGKAFYKRLYFSTYDKYLVFSRPAAATPPHPPRLATLMENGIPSAEQVTREAPTMYDIEPYQIQDDKIRWLKPGRPDAVAQSDAEAMQEERRNIANLTASDGYIDLTQIVKVRKLKWGATAADEGLDSGSDVDFHEDVENTRHDDGVTTEIDEDRVFELVLHNDLIIRLQAYSKATRDEWMKRLHMLVKYWKRRAEADMKNLKATRAANLTNLNIDEDQEARLGQFARKWEVSRSEANPEVYNMCRLTACRTITMSGMLYRKPRRRSAFQKCSVFLSGGHMLIYQATLRKSTGEQVPHIHQEKQQIINLKDCYVYSGLIVEDDLLYQNRTFDTSHAGMLAATPRVYLDDGWTASDVDVMTCFVVWQNRRKGWFRSVTDTTIASDDAQDEEGQGRRRAKIKRVAQLGVPGKGMVFKCRSRAERDLWVTSVAAEIEGAVERELIQLGKGRGDDLADVRLEN